jgi:hypothetical protein
MEPSEKYPDKSWCGKIVSWTASHVNHRARLELMDLMLESVTRGVSLALVSISYDEKMKKDVDNWTQKLSKTYSNVIFFIHHSQMLQFNHLEHLCNICNCDDNDMILFMDDDDLLLALPSLNDSINIIKGYQYVPVDERGCQSRDDKTPNMNVSQILEIIPEFESKWSKEIDFSGYIARYDIVRRYFAKRKKTTGQMNPIEKLINSMEDTTFMDYLDDQPAVFKTKDPIVFHRVWGIPDGGVSHIWKQGLF